ncbi:tyrosine-type recombinase/integrase [Clostridium pasteurianum]|uniref:Site-specific recombinase XerD n=1 Tax=Clostridium pasteurianum BC1 TaxID=86416 RepID=R4K562_CLOPA|nr:tyrosine-type recombinase/integrase [Clostridium pasteurianum]AGK97708.1 site-specific recombinase XerD [Clostridium pasteurianum BC1]
MKNLHVVKRGQVNKYEEIITYLSQDECYWLNNDVWDVTKEIFIGDKVHNCKHINFENFNNVLLKNEIKYYLLYNFRNKNLTGQYMMSLANGFKHFSSFLNKYYYNVNSFNDIEYKEIENKWKFYLANNSVKVNMQKSGGQTIISILLVIKFIIKFYDNRDETEKDVWYIKNIKGVNVRATQNMSANRLNFKDIPEYYRETVKRYFKTIITKKSFSLCCNILTYIRYFFTSFYSRGYKDGFVENLQREDIEIYVYLLLNDRKGKSKSQTAYYISYLRRFLEYIQMAQYDKAPKKEVAFLIFQDDIPNYSIESNTKRAVKFIPEPILKQIDNNIMDLPHPEFIPIYILLRETGWRGTDILNLRYDNCLEQIWNNKEQKYNYYLCGEITKTGIAQLKIPVRDKVAEMVQKCIDKAKELSTEENNSEKYLFNTYEGKDKGYPLSKRILVYSIYRLISDKNITDVKGDLYHFKLHSLRHTRAKEYVEQGMGISVIQQILGHQSLQMTVHYATVSENILYEKWKKTEDLDLFRVNTETNELEQVDLDSEDGQNLVRYEYVKKNLDAVKVPFGVCFKLAKLPCKQQMNFCLTCASFCTTVENIPEYEEEIENVKKQINISERCGRELWAEKNRTYLKLLEDTLEKVREQKIVHKNGKSREEVR